MAPTCLLQVIVLEEGRCDHLPAELAFTCGMWWRVKAVSIVLQPALLLQATDVAVEALFAKQGVALPPRDASGAFVAQFSADAEPSPDSSAGPAAAADPFSALTRRLRGPAGATSADRATLLWLLVPLVVVLLVQTAVCRRRTAGKATL